MKNKSKCNKCGQEYEHYIDTNGYDLVSRPNNIAPNLSIITSCTNPECEHFEIVKTINSIKIKFDD